MQFYLNNSFNGLVQYIKFNKLVLTIATGNIRLANTKSLIFLFFCNCGCIHFFPGPESAKSTNTEQYTK